MVAKTLSEVLNVFDPQRPLQGAELEEYYVARPMSQLELMRVFLEDKRDPVKVLFTGHRGSGKSTELNKLATMLEDKFFIVRFSILRTLNPQDMTYVDLLLALATSLFKQATDANVLKRRTKGLVGDELLKDVYRWFTQEVIEEKFFEPKAEASAAASLNLLAVKLEGKIGAEASTRRTVRERVEPRLAELLERVNYVLDDVRRNARRRPLIIVEDTDKLDLTRARDLFLEHATSLAVPKAHIVYTFPVALRHLTDFPQIRNNFAQRFILPNIRLHRQDGTTDEVGEAMLRRIAINRMDASLILSDALNLAVAMSGGLPLTLVQLIQSAANLALSRGQKVIDESSVQAAITEIRNDYQALLEPRHYQTLRRYHQSKWLVNEDEVREVLHNLSLLEYANDERWCDVHPIVLPLLEREEASRRQEAQRA
jgi:hypothetical protein